MSSSKLSALGIPSSFQVLGHTIKTKEVPELKDAGHYGDYDGAHNEIRLFTEGCCNDVILHTFYHELVHCFEDKGAIAAIDNEEVRADVLGGLMAQFHTSRRF